MQNSSFKVAAAIFGAGVVLKSSALAAAVGHSRPSSGLRVCPKSSGRIAEFSEHEAY